MKDTLLLPQASATVAASYTVILATASELGSVIVY